MDDIRLEKALEALIDDMANDMGEEAKDCYILRRLENIMLEMKSCNNAEILRTLGFLKRTSNNPICEKCCKFPK
jgi:hypothetical protein